MEYSLINPALLLLMKHLFIAQPQKAPKFLAGFHWSTFHNHKHSEFTEKDRNTPVYRIGLGCAGRA